MDTTALAHYAKRRGGIANALAGHVAVEVTEDGDQPVAFLLNADTFYLLLAAAKEPLPDIAVSPVDEAENYMSSNELLKKLGELPSG
jgi:hypothetical protein